MDDPLDTDDYTPLEELARIGNDGQYPVILDSHFFSICGVIFGDKPAAFVEVIYFGDDYLDHWELTEPPARTQFNDLDLAHTYELHPSDQYEVNEVRIYYTISRTRDHLHDGSWGGGHVPYARRLGRKYGYPKDAIDAYIESCANGEGQKATAADEYFESLLGDTHTAEELAFAKLVGWAPVRNEAAVQRAIDEGRRRYDRYIAFAREHELTMLRRRLRATYEDYRRCLVTSN